MSRNEHHRTPLHHAAAKNRPADGSAPARSRSRPERDRRDRRDAARPPPSQEHADPGIITMLLAAGAKLDFIAALNLKRYDLAEAMLRDDPSRIGPDGRDTIALHLAVSERTRQRCGG